MDFKTFLQEFKKITDYDFCDYSENSISRRLQKICDETKMTFEEILRRCVTDRPFMGRVVEDITVNTTELFRDPQVWVSLFSTLYKSLPKTTVTFWHIGCSVGLEVYSNLIMLSELNLLDKCRIIGTDINPRVLSVAKKGEYAYSFNKYFEDNFNAVMHGINSKSKFSDYFDIDEKKDQIKIKPPLLGKPRFICHNLVMEQSPFAYRVDVVFFRNVMIYFNDALQRKIMAIVYSKMYDNSFLVLGKREDLPKSLKSKFISNNIFFQKAN